MSMSRFPQDYAHYTVKWVGAQRNVLQGDISGHIALASISGLQNLYAVGPAERLQGEVSIFDSVPSISRITDGAIGIETDSKVNACFLVYAQVNAWRSVTIPTAIGDEATLATYMVKVASELGIDVGQPFPFLINATPERATFHVLDKRDGLPHNAELHEKAKVRFVLQWEPVEIIGFYSNRHRGIFTPGDANVHMHVKSADGRMSGHLEKIHLERGASLAVPRVEKSDETKRAQPSER
jgi:acetolactate decarboxylase